MFTKYLQPDLVLEDTILSISPQVLTQFDLKGLIIDVDETLVPLRESHLSPEVEAWFKQVRSACKLWLASNNISEARISKIAHRLDVPFLFGAQKPSRRKLRTALSAMALPPQQVAMVGDRLFTDVIAGNRLGLFTILVDPMTNPDALKHYQLRNLEVVISQLLGVSLTRKHNFTKSDDSTPLEI
ncbi:MAG: YqeG family HAD IIIA-type phosphatase [Cyanobacteria bacterium P01_H01_bin.15]